MNWWRRQQYDDGNVLIMSVVIAALLFATALGYMKWAADERWDTAYEEATVQAYFLAQTGLIERGYMYLRTRKPSELPTATVYSSFPFTSIFSVASVTRLASSLFSIISLYPFNLKNGLYFPVVFLIKSSSEPSASSNR